MTQNNLRKEKEIYGRHIVYDNTHISRFRIQLTWYWDDTETLSAMKNLVRHVLYLVGVKDRHLRQIRDHKIPVYYLNLIFSKPENGREPPGNYLIKKLTRMKKREKDAIKKKLLNKLTIKVREQRRRLTRTRLSQPIRDLLYLKNTDPIKTITLLKAYF